MTQSHDDTPIFDLPEQFTRRLVSAFRDSMAKAHGRARRADAPARSENLLEWGRTFLPQHFRLPPSRLHRWLAGRLDALRRQRGRQLNVLGPRGGAKSTLGSLAHPLRAAVENTEPYIWIVSDTKDQAVAHLDNIKAELTENETLRRAYPESTGRGAVWRKERIVLRNGCAIEAFGTGQRLRGRRFRASRPSLIICDDIQNDGHILSPAMRDRSRNWFHGVLLKAGNRRTNLLHLATALHRQAIAWELIETPGWESRVFRAIEQWPRNMELWAEWERIYADASNPSAERDARRYYVEHRVAMDEEAVVLWPEQEDLYRLMCMRVQSGKTAFDREKQNIPANPDLCEWPEEYFGDDIWFNEWPESPSISVIALDPSKGGDARRGDYSAFVCLGLGEDGVIYVEADMARRPTPRMVEDGVALCKRFRPHIFGLETNQFQELLREDFAVAFREAGLVALEPAPIVNRMNKETRIRRLGPLLSARRLRFHAASPSTRLLVEQLRDFPIGSHDDGPDALEMALQLAAGISDGPRNDDGLGDRLIR